MNYLAHIYLARHSELAMIGALLGDFDKSHEPGKYPKELEQEILIHRTVDSFTDNHPTTVEAKACFHASRRRYAGILLDVFYDHLLSKNWDLYCDVPLQSFVHNFYDAMHSNRYLLPQNLLEIAPKMASEDWLGSYQDIHGFEQAIMRISHRLSKNGHVLREGIIDILDNYSNVTLCFDRFFPELEKHVFNVRENILTQAIKK